MSGYGEVQRTCQNDGLPMQKVNDRGVVIDQCGRCGGVWLDGGELQALINQVASMPGFQTRPASHFGAPGHRRRHHGSSGFLGSFFSS